MMSRFIFLWFAYVSLALGCAFPTAPHILHSAGNAGAQGSKLIQSWESEDSKFFNETTVPDQPSLRQFRQTAQSLVADLSPVGLLKNALTHFSPESADALNLRFALQNAALLIRPMNCLEALLLAAQTDRGDMADFPTEFTAFVLRSKSKPQIKIFYYTINQPGIGGLKEIVGYVERELAANADWYLWMNLHNHNFFFHQGNLSGVTAPSGPDVGAFRSLAQDLGLKEARITNGFDTITLPAAYFSQLSEP